jgi:hypothetical protein
MMTTKEKREYRSEALDELTATIEDVFYTASLFGSAGDHEAAQRLGDIGDKLHEEYLRARTGKALKIS